MPELQHDKEDGMQTRDLALAVFVLLLIAFGVAFSLSDQTPSDEASAWAKKTLAGLSLEKKIGQIVCSDLAGGYIAEGDPKLEPPVRRIASPGRRRPRPSRSGPWAST